MHQTVYIDVDEEITSILDRVRQEQTMDVFLVVPKGAMLLNSIINLKLLRKEVEKMGKTIVIVAPNDKRAKTIIERAGIKAEEYNQSMNAQMMQGASSGGGNEEEIGRAVSESVEETHQQIHQGGLDIGSTSFFAKGAENKTAAGVQQAAISSTGEQKAVVQQQRVSPIPQEGVECNQQRQQQTRQSQQAQQAQQAQQVQRVQQAQQQQKQRQDSVINENGKPEDTSKERKYFDHADNLKGIKKEGGLVTQLFGKKSLIIAGVCVLILGIGVIGWYSINYPKLQLTIHPLKEEISEEVKITVREDVTEINIDDKSIPGEYMEITLEKMLDFDATGSKVIDKNGTKSSGVVTIYNHFSDKPQSLVKTTRVLSKDGKLFRLTKGVTIPGMDGEKPGKVDVAIQADKSGEAFNIDKSKFTIVAWKGTPRGEKFKVESENKMSGGVTPTSTTTKKIISKVDLDNARKKTIEALDESLASEIGKHLNQNQAIVASSAKNEILSSNSSHLVGTVTDKFTYTVKYKVEVIAFYQDDVKVVSEAYVKNELKREYYIGQDFKTETKRGIVDLDKKTLTVYINVSGTAWMEIDKNKLKEAISGIDADEIKEFLSKDVGVESAEIDLNPDWSGKMPSNVNKIKIEVVKE